MRTVDVVVVGAGPAGSSAAITLARAGRSVTVIDKARFPRDKFCGDGLTTGALRLLEELGVVPAAIESWQQVDDIVVRSPSGRTVRLPLPRDAGCYAAIAQRVHLDAALVDVARAAGADLLDGHALETVQRTDDRVVLRAGGEEIHARYVVGADGMWSPLRKLLGLQNPGYLGEWHAFRQYFTGVSASPHELHVWFERDFLPGYAWSFPLPDGRANVGFGIARGARVRTRDMKSLWPDLLQRPHIRAALGEHAQPEGTHRAWPIPARVDGVALSAHRTFFVGDAAAATDPMTGEGIAQALQTGMLAARAIVAAGATDPARAAALYERSVARELVPDHRMSRRLMRVLASYDGARGAVRVPAMTDWTSRNFARWLFEDYPRALLLTPHRWHRGAFTGPGAFRSR